ncbi:MULTISPECIES: hypothetical protein [Mesorhizobium]|uniref:Uncharacterized protein n=2 Tax=Mesorhizobium TaxID=68287 RepID=A0A1A5HUS5_RHILI|nr:MULTISPECIES: hypothetical protein [Mesorhizobium]ETA72348.1 hypothetical protein MesloDRAFT_1218 [Mesorhizobium japonicum R7A]MBE1709679.1 hypothetical protein [Mesorhizobium japonicum]MBE1714348.1 hypothetical protein [Mesorhizobium japonicum]MUT25328.1 hypothetical protein [Mesorhizobium japonicum]MUT28618.1 hypothetical protein [Mesorhizobium japonicum]
MSLRKVQRNAEILSMKASGKNAVEIARTIGVSTTRIRTILKFYELHPEIKASDLERPPKRPKAVNS